MPVPDFSPGEVLTASAMDSVAMWLVKTQTIGAGVSSVTVSNAFSADYDNYRIVVSNVVVSAAGNSSFLKLSASTGATYFASGWFMAPSSATINGVLFNGVTDGIWIGVTGGRTSFSFDLMSPFLSAPTNLVGLSAGSGNTYYNTMSGSDSNAASSTGFSLIQATQNWTGGTIKVYGYRN
jgi:hypothetical protein